MPCLYTINLLGAFDYSNRIHLADVICIIKGVKVLNNFHFFWCCCTFANFELCLLYIYKYLSKPKKFSYKNANKV